MNAVTSLWIIIVTDREEVQCPACAETILAAAKKCRFCGEWLQARKVNAQSESRSAQEIPSSHIGFAQIAEQAKASEYSWKLQREIRRNIEAVDRPRQGGGRGLGGLVLAIGIIWMLVAFNMDTSVSGFSNLGLMNEQRNHLIGGGVVSIIGVIISITEVIIRVAGDRRSSEEQQRDVTRRSQ